MNRIREGTPNIYKIKRQGSIMKIRAIYKNNVLEPLKELDLREGEEVEIEVRRSMKDFHGKLEIKKEIADKIIEMEIWS